MALERGSKSINRVEGRRCNMIEGSPVIRNEVLSPESLKQSKSITAGKVPFAKSRLPPRRMSDRKKGEIQTSSIRDKMFFNQVGRITGKRSISSKKAGYFISIYKIHICCTSPAIHTISVSPVSCRGSTDFHVLEHSFFTRGDRNCVAVTLFP